MTTIKATCPGCGEVDLTPEEILLRVANTGTNSNYGFSCPACGDFVQKPADSRVVRLLLSGGVIPVSLDIPAEALEAHYGPPLTYDEILSFHELLESENWFDQLSRMV